MKPAILILFSLFLNLPSFAVAQSIPTNASICGSGQTSVWIILKESFRYDPSLDDGTHRFFLFVGCSISTSQSASGTDSTLQGTLYLGKENDADYPYTLPQAIAGSVSSFPFSGSEQASKALTQGGFDQIQSTDGQISASGDFYSNRDLAYTVDGVVVPATLPTGL